MSALRPVAIQAFCFRNMKDNTKIIHDWGTSFRELTGGDLDAIIVDRG